MHKLPTDKLLSEIDSVHRLVILAAKRARQIAKGALPQVEKVSPNLGIVALEEFVQGKLEWGTRSEVKARYAERAAAARENAAKEPSEEDAPEAETEE
ncbi:DNA-directed RNA polymerase subunit omega [Candidatus Hydrogenedentota bacterium]